MPPAKTFNFIKDFSMGMEPRQVLVAGAQLILWVETCSNNNNTNKYVPLSAM